MELARFLECACSIIRPRQPTTIPVVVAGAVPCLEQALLLDVGAGAIHDLNEADLVSPGWAASQR